MQMQRLRRGIARPDLLLTLLVVALFAAGSTVCMLAAEQHLAPPAVPSMRGIDLHLVELQGANLSGTDLRGANLQDAILKNVILRETDLRGANMKQARLHSVDFTGADLTGADLWGALFDSETRWPRGFDPARSGAQRFMLIGDCPL